MIDLLSTTVTYSSGTGGAGIGILIVVYVAIYIIFALGMYGSFKKAGEPGWAAFIPFYNWWVIVKISGRPQSWFWFIFLNVIPFVGWIGFLVVAIIVLNDVSRSFGHGGAFTVGLVLLGPIFWYILWLGPSRYLGPAARMGVGYPGGGSHPPQGYPAQGYPAQPAPGYPAQPAPGYPAQPAPPQQQPPPAVPPQQQPPPAVPPQQQPPPPVPPQ